MTIVFVIFHILFLQRFYYTPILRHCQPFFGNFMKFSKIFSFFPIDFQNEQNGRHQALNRPSEERIFRLVSKALRHRFAIEPDIPPRHREAPDKEPRVSLHVLRAR